MNFGLSFANIVTPVVAKQSDVRWSYSGSLLLASVPKHLNIPKVALQLEKQSDMYRARSSICLLVATDETCDGSCVP